MRGPTTRASAVSTVARKHLHAAGSVAQRVVERAQLDRFADLSAHHGDALLVAFRAMPVLGEATTILAGLSRMPRPRFLAVVSIVLPVLIVLAVRRAARAPAS